MGLEYVKGFFTSAVLTIAAINMVCGGMLGLSAGFVAVHTTFTSINENCTLYESPVACGTVTGTSCHWGLSNISGKEECLFPEPIDCHLFDSTSSSTCSMLPYCTWVYDDHVCQHTAGYTAIESGVFSCATVFGGLLGSLAIGHFVNLLGRKRSVILCGMCLIFCCVLVHIASATFSYRLLIPARVLLGLCVGALCCVGPMYVDEMIPAAYLNPVGMMFQAAVTTGLMLPALLGYVINPTDFTVNVKMWMRFQILDALLTIAAVGVLCTGLLMRESTKWLQAVDERSDLLLNEGKRSGDVEDQSIETGWRDISKMHLLVAFTLAFAQQMTGCNAVFNYAPNITKSMNFAPLTGNVLVLAWNALCSLLSIPIASKFSMRSMFLIGTLFAGFGGLLTGIPVFPGVTTDTLRGFLGLTGVMLFLLAFEIGVGSTFFVLGQTVFPKAARVRGSTLTMVCMFAFNMSVTALFPIVVEALSGGPSGDQNKGLGITFMFFGACGLSSVTLLFNFLRPYDL